MVEQVVSGGQTGVDRAVLDVALTLGIPCGGWCPKGRRAQDGVLAPRYPLRETPSEEYAQRTTWNVRDSDGTLILTKGTPTGGTAFTLQIAVQLGKPCLIVDLEKAARPSTVHRWLTRYRIRVLNVAGPRENHSPGIYKEAEMFLRRMLRSRK